MSSCHLQTHGLGKVMGTKVMEAFGPSDIYCSLSPLGANVVMVDGQSLHPQGYSLWGNLSDGQTLRVVGPADLHMDILAPSPSLNSPLQPGLWLINLLELGIQHL